MNVVRLTPFRASRYSRTQAILRLVVCTQDSVQLLYLVANDFTKLVLAWLGFIVILFSYMSVCTNYVINECI